MDLLQTALPVSIFCFKLWTWFLQFHSLRSNASSGLSAWSYFLTSFQEQSSAIPPPPPFLAAHPQGQKPGPKGICSLCKKKICNPACLPTGYVFCYTCIHPWIQTHLKCPITLKAMSMNEIHKVYSSSK
ncbi:ubiquitin-protein ligase peroxin 12 [Coelomomyces lativittatus]|nr:ubiquitin-protein ligase peroxin 12 [Coelomomyces lativittatus]